MSQPWNNKLALRETVAKLVSSISDARFKSRDLTSELIGCFACAHPSAGSCHWPENLSAEPHFVSKGASAGGTLSIPSTVLHSFKHLPHITSSASSMCATVCVQPMHGFFCCYSPLYARRRQLLLLVLFLQSWFVDSFNRNLNKLLNTTVKLHLNSHCQSEGLLCILPNGIWVPVPK